MSRLALGIGAVLLVGLVMGACGSATTRVPVKGPDSNIARIVGDWEGQYESGDLNRQGTIKFHLEMGRHTAVGHVTMYPEGPMGPAQPIAITFVEVEGGKIQGKLERYRDPRCECDVETQFTGALSSDTAIEGTFTTKPLDKDETAVGRWAVHKIQ